jgi:aminopeptidase N
VYEQGADRVHTLRGYMGDSLFFACLRGYLQRYKFSAVNSYTLRDYLVASSGLKNINDFFNDWIFGCGFPDFSIEHTRVNSTSSGYEVGISIRQRQDHTSHYFTNVPLEVAYFDSLGNKTVRKSSVSGSCTQFFTILPFDPAYIALDFDEKLSDAVTDQWFMMSGTNQRIDFEVAKMTVNLKQSTDSSLVRIEHHFVAPDASMNPIRGLHLSDYRYWDVGGLWSADFQASAIVAYNGSKNAQGYLDNTLITNSEDSLVLMYRADAESMWQIDSGAVRNTQGSMTDKIGTFAISNLQKGQYALAIYQADKVDSPQTIAGCAAPLMADDAAEGFKAYPNAAHAEELNIEIEGKDVYKRCIMINMIGDMVMDRTLKEGQNKFTVYMNGLPRGTYMISLIDKDNKRISKKIQKQS